VGQVECRRRLFNSTLPVAVGSANVADFRDLHVDVLYKISVVAVNRYGSSPAAASVTHRLAADPCGDGVIYEEQCDDANDAADDGCVACETQLGWACWGEPSTCCGPCPSGQFRAECGLTGLQGQRSGAGRCVPCPVGTYKPGMGQWDTGCLACLAGKYSLGGASECTAHEECEPGYELSRHSASEAGTCLACQLGTYKSSNMSSCQPQDLLLPCPPGSYRTPAPSRIASTTNDGQVESVFVVLCDSIDRSPSSTYVGALFSLLQCTPCPVDTFKANIGSWHTACTPCPSENAGTQGEEVEPPPACTQTVTDLESAPLSPLQLVDSHLDSQPPLARATSARSCFLLLLGLLLEFPGRVRPERVHLCARVAGQPGPLWPLLPQCR
jgi:cysteine-rich repeat protein